MKKKRGRIIAISITIVVLALISYSVTKRIVGATSKTNSDTIAIPVVTRYPRIQNIEKIYTFTGNLKPKETVTVLSKIPGKIESIYVSEGDRISINQTVAQIEDDTVKLQLKQAEAAFKAAEAQYQKALRGVRKEELENAEALVKQAEEDLKTAEENFNRVKKLYKAGTIPKAKYEETESKLREAKTKLENAKRNLKMMREGATKEDIAMAKANMEAMRAQYELAKLQFDYTRIKSPISGSVAHIFVTEGNMVNQTMPIMAIIREDPIVAEINVPEKYYQEIKNKQKTIEVHIKPLSIPEGRIFKGKITKISSIIDPSSRTFSVEAEIDNREGKLLSGMFVEAGMIVEKHTNVLTVPKSAVIKRNGKRGVFIVKEPQPNNKIARFVEIKSGIERNNWIEIKNKDLTQHTKIIIDGNSFLENEQLIREVKEE